MHNDIKSMNTTTLAYIGDAVYELHIRELLIGRSKGDVGKVHKRAVSYV
ncbi:MAG: ribonuclease III, partial [Mogibacterium diversum]|nr:ribonuclease III [Mogibacterium diversum]